MRREGWGGGGKGVRLAGVGSARMEAGEAHGGWGSGSVGRLLWAGPM
jgi:hypothetical protein